MKELNLKKKVKLTTTFYGIPLTLEQTRNTEKILERLQDLSPSSSKIELKFKEHSQKIKGILTVKSYGTSFTSTKTAEDPESTLLLLKNDIEDQLLDWKRKRFSQSLFEKVSPKSRAVESFAS